MTTIAQSLLLLIGLSKIIYYKVVKITINALGLAKVILNIIIWYYGIPDSIVIGRSLFFKSNQWLLVCYFSGIKQKLFTTSYLQTNGQSKRQNSTMEAYFCASSTTNKMTRQNSSQYMSLYIIIHKMQALVTQFLSSIAIIIFKSLTKKIFILALNLRLQMN